MRVLHISTFDTFGAARAMLRWHAHLKEADIESRVLCFQKSPGDSDIFSPSLLPDRAEAIKSRATQERWIDLCRTSYSDNFFSQPFYADPLFREELVDWAELLHIHWISRSINLSHLADLAARGKPLVLTPHDLWTVTGGCHYPAGCEQFRGSCRACPMVNEESQRLIEIAHRFKRTIFLQSVQALICPSTWIRDKIVCCPGFETIQNFVIPYAWESEGFWPEEKAAARKALGVSSDRKWVFFVADNVNETRKGFSDFCQLIRGAEERLRVAGKENSFGILVAGRAEGIHETDFGVRVVNLRFLGDTTDLRNAYSAADLLVYTGLEDNLPNVITEALGCGTPVLGYATGGVVDQVQPGSNGILVATGDIQELTNSFVDLLLNPSQIDGLAAGARRSVEINFDNRKIVENLRSAYNAALSNGCAAAPPPNVIHELAEYEAFAMRALVDLLENAQKRTVEFEGKVRWLQGHIEKLNLEAGGLREILERCFREIDEIFSVSPPLIRTKHAEIQKNEELKARPGKNDESIGEKWREISTKTYLLKEYLAECRTE